MDGTLRHRPCRRRSCRHCPRPLASHHLRLASPQSPPFSSAHGTTAQAAAAIAAAIATPAISSTLAVAASSATRGETWRLHEIVMTNIVWCVAYYRGLGEQSFMAR